MELESSSSNNLRKIKFPKKTMNNVKLIGELVMIILAIIISVLSYTKSNSTQDELNSLKAQLNKIVVDARIDQESIRSLKDVSTNLSLIILNNVNETNSLIEGLNKTIEYELNKFQLVILNNTIVVNETTTFLNEIVNNLNSTVEQSSIRLQETNVILNNVGDLTRNLNSTINSLNDQIINVNETSVDLTIQTQNFTQQVDLIKNNLNIIINNNNDLLKFTQNNVESDFGVSFTSRLSTSTYVIVVAILGSVKINMSINGEETDCWRSFNTVASTTAQYGSIGIPPNGYCPSIFMNCAGSRVAFDRCTSDDPLERSEFGLCSDTYEIIPYNRCVRSSYLLKFKSNINVLSSLLDCI